MDQKRILDIIEYSNPSDNDLVHKEPPSGVDIRYGAQLIVRETQQAVFFKDGRAVSTFGPGTYTLTTNNVPILADFLTKFTQGGKTPFQAEVFYVNTKIFEDMKWGTKTPIDMMDPDLGIVQLRAFGRFSMKIVDAQLFVTSLVDARGTYPLSKFEEFCKDVILTRLNDLIGEQFHSYFKIRKDMDEFSAAMKFKIKDDLGKYGVEVRDFFISQVSVPEDVQKAFSERAKMGALGDMNKYMQYKTANAIGDMATKPAGGGGDPMSAGMGLGMGMMMPQMMQQAMQGSMGGGQQMGFGQAQAPQAPPQQAAATTPCPNCQAPVLAGSKFCPNCGQNMIPPKPKCPNCQAEYVPGAKFCANCGQTLMPAAAQPKKCANCGSEVAADTKFCQECGNKME